VVVFAHGTVERGDLRLNDIARLVAGVRRIDGTDLHRDRSRAKLRQPGGRERVLLLGPQDELEYEVVVRVHYGDHPSSIAEMCIWASNEERDRAASKAQLAAPLSGRARLARATV